MVQKKPQFSLSKAVNAAVKEAAKLANSYNIEDREAILVSAVRLKSMCAAMISDFESKLKDSMKG